MAIANASIFANIEALGVSTFVRESTWAYPMLESVHVMAIALVVGSIWLVDLRIIGVVRGGRGLDRAMSEMLPITWTVFAVAALTGGLMFISSAAYFADNAALWIKLGLLCAAGCNMIFFHKVALREWITKGSGDISTKAMRAAGVASMVIWTCTIVAGRWIGFL